MTRILGLSVLAAILSSACISDKDTAKEIVMDDEGLRDVANVKTGWSLSAAMKGKVSSKTASMQAAFPQPGPYTIQFSTNLADVVASAFWKRCLAYISWSVEGNSVQRIVDVADGMSISGAGQGVQVKLVDQSYQIAPGPIQPAFDYKVDVIVVRGTRANTGQPPTLVGDRSTSVGFGQYKYIALPEAAGVTQFRIALRGVKGGVPYSLTVTDVIIRQKTQDDTSQYSTLSEHGTAEQWIPITPGARGIMIENLMTAAGEFVWYSVLFGIDG